jgi:branched-chain amino acid transport system substrate-binding protein
MVKQEKDTIRVGFISGFNSPYGIIVKNQFKGAVLAVEEINNDGGILGKEVELIDKDDEMNVELAKEKAKELIEKDHVHLIVGTLSSATASAVNEVAKAAGIPMMVINQVNIN